MSTFPDPTAPTVRPRPVVSAWAPLVHLIRTTLVEFGEVTFRVLPADQVDEWHNPRVLPHERVIELPVDDDDVRGLTTLVYGLYHLLMGAEDPRLADGVAWFAEVATNRTVAEMGEVAR